MSGVNTRLRGLTIGEQRKRAAKLRARHMTYGEIGALIGVSAIRARDLCRQQARVDELGASTLLSIDLSRRATLALVSGERACHFGEDLQTRLTHLDDIAASYSRQEFLAEQFVGAAICREVETWLASKGRAFQTKSNRKGGRADLVRSAPEAPPTEAIASLQSHEAPQIDVDATKSIAPVKQAAETPAHDLNGCLRVDENLGNCCDGLPLGAERSM